MNQRVSPDDLTQQEKVMFMAFRAGFDASGEGWNGEYVNARYTPRMLEEQLLEMFISWQRRMAQETL